VSVKLESWEPKLPRVLGAAHCCDHPPVAIDKVIQFMVVRQCRQQLRAETLRVFANVELR
jgi:hypothetical protein